jgi:PAS domain-containing protein
LHILRATFPQDADKKAKRAPREDLSGLTAEERVERRRARARAYSHCARQRHKALLQEARVDLAAMELYRTIIENAPHIVMVLSADLQSTVLYANKAVSRLLCIVDSDVVGR